VARGRQIAELGVDAGEIDERVGEVRRQHRDVLELAARVGPGAAAAAACIAGSALSDGGPGVRGPRCASWYAATSPISASATPTSHGQSTRGGGGERATVVGSTACARRSLSAS
jgi:hypothetical protein